jgi:hypothetical protein
MSFANPSATVAITDFRMKTKTLAKVIISFTGQVGRQDVHDILLRKFGEQASPVKASFKVVKPGVAVGFVKANRAVRVVNDNELKAYRKIGASNVLMDQSDESLWEVKSGGTGSNKYLVRHGQEDLSALVASVAHRRADMPRLNQITMAKASKHDLVAFVDDEGDVDHGFAMGNSTDGTKVRVFSHNRRMPLTVDLDSVVSMYNVPIPASLHQVVSSALTPEEKNDANAYWRQLYSYGPEFLKETIQQTNEGTFA